VLNSVFAAVASGRRLFLTGVLILAASLGAAAELGNYGLAPVLLVLFLGFNGLSMLATARYHPAALLAEPNGPAIATVASPARVLSAAGFLNLAGLLGAQEAGNIVAREELWQFDVFLVVFLAAAAALLIYVAWGSAAVRLRPDGVYDRQPLGSRLIPWDAFDRGYPAVPVKTTRLALYYQRPELVRRRGVYPGTQFLTTATDANYLALAIDHYVTHPEHRPAIGTPADFQRLNTSLAGAAGSGVNPTR
jgi:hypothetical protein